MTREVAIKILMGGELNPCVAEDREACDMAIKALEQEPTTKNDLGVDLVSRAEVLKLMQDNWHTHNGDWAMQESMDDIRALPPVTPQEPQSFKWCTDCKEYDQEKHCCHRWSKVIRDTVAEIGQEPKPMVEIDLYSVIKQKYIEREVLDKIDEIITDALDKSTDQKESQTLRWVLDKMSEVT